jgi:hypothetical protein
MLELVIRAGNPGALFEGVSGECAALHSGNGGDLLEKLLFSEMFHNVTSILGTLIRENKPSFLLGRILSHTHGVRARKKGLGF